MIKKDCFVLVFLMVEVRVLIEVCILYLFVYGVL